MATETEKCCALAAFDPATHATGIDQLMADIASHAAAGGWSIDHDLTDQLSGTMTAGPCADGYGAGIQFTLDPFPSDEEIAQRGLRLLLATHLGADGHAIIHDRKLEKCLVQIGDTKPSGVAFTVARVRIEVL